MRETVLDIWLEFNGPLEVRGDFMYLDIKGFVSTCVGNKDPTSTWHELTPPTDAERAASLAITRPLHLAEDEIDRIVFAKLDQTESRLRGRTLFSGYDDWPADAQLSLLQHGLGHGTRSQLPEVSELRRERRLVRRGDRMPVPTRWRLHLPTKRS